MRTSITLDDDVYEIASHYATARDTTLGAAIGELVRKATSPSPSPTASCIALGPHGLPVFTSGGSGRVITTEMVKAAQEDDLDWD